MSRLKRPPVGEMWKLGEGVTDQESSSSLESGSKLREHGRTRAFLEEPMKLGTMSEGTDKIKHIFTDNRFFHQTKVNYVQYVISRWETTDHPQGVLRHDSGITEQNHTVTCLMLKAKANDRRKILSLRRDEFCVPWSDLTADQMA
ncbi:hypothetical protein TNCV_4168591 [Trichonephila clavipes]|nr:hypothetical protein TNCV_4168591 [Trichonephila clavipes]